MKIPYLSNNISRNLRKRIGGTYGGIAVKVLGITLYELPITPATLRWVRIHNA